MSEIRIKTVYGNELQEYTADLARLRIKVFREYPYLYDGTFEYESKYLATYISCPLAMAVLVFDNEKVIGASTGIPLAYETDEFKAPFLKAGMRPEDIFYCGESVLQKEYRGRGLYKEFFAGRENYARTLGDIRTLAFCGVVRPESHPLKPRGYKPLDDIWSYFGYRPLEGVLTHFNWQDIDQKEQTLHPMQYWVKDL